jgi:formate C-acetyltransferase
MTSGDAHLAVNFPLLLEKGLDGLRHKVDERRSALTSPCWKICTANSS